MSHAADIETSYILDKGECFLWSEMQDLHVKRSCMSSRRVSRAGGGGGGPYVLR